MAGNRPRWRSHQGEGSRRAPTLAPKTSGFALSKELKHEKAAAVRDIGQGDNDSISNNIQNFINSISNSNRFSNTTSASNNNNAISHTDNRKTLHIDSNNKESNCTNNNNNCDNDNDNIISQHAMDTEIESRNCLSSEGDGVAYLNRPTEYWRSNSQEASSIDSQDQGSSEDAEDAKKIELEENSEANVEPIGGIPPHPYAHLLKTYAPNRWQLQKWLPVPFPSLEESACTFIDTKVKLDEMMAKLKEVKEIAVSTKRDAYRSLSGNHSIILLATRTEDFIVDSLVLKDEVKVLNEIFTDVSVLKVFYNCDFHFEWLQTYLGLYVINLFDIFVAVGEKLGKLLKMHCDVTCQYKAAVRWDERPLTEESVIILRHGIHYLLHIYDHRRNCLKIDALKELYMKCNDKCAMRFPDRDSFKTDNHSRLYKLMATQLNHFQFDTFRLLFYWRQRIGAQNDKSPEFVLPNKMLLLIAKVLPQDVEGVQECVSGNPFPLDSKVEEILSLVLKSLEDIPKTMKRSRALQKMPFFVTAKRDRADAHFKCGTCGKLHKYGQMCSKVRKMTEAKSKQKP